MKRTYLSLVGVVVGSILCGGVLPAVAAGASPIVRGALCLTFDDRNFDAWEANLPLFRKYGAHATFFACGPIDARAEACLRRLAADGHSIGLHGFRHKKVTAHMQELGEEGYLKDEILPQLSVCRAKGLPVNSFAYPYSARNARTDALLLKHFRRLRGGGKGSGPVPLAEALGKQVFIGLCATSPRDTPAQIAAMLPALAASNAVLVAYAHDIEAEGQAHDPHNLTVTDLEMLLAAAQRAGVALLGFDDLPNASCGTSAVPPEIPYDFTRQRLFSGFDGRLCKIQPTIATDGKGTLLLAYQRLLLSGMDVFYGQFMSRSTDGGKTWSEPVELTALKDTHEDGYRVARYATVRYSAANAKWFALGLAQLYLDDKRPFQKYVFGRPYGTPLYVSVDAERGVFTGYRTLPFPVPYEMAMPFGQALECAGGDLLVPFYFRPIGGGKKGRVLVVRYAFDGDALKIVRAGTPVVRDDLARGVGEPSLARLGNKIYLTLRSDEMGLWCESDDGLSFSAPKPWTWTNGTPIGNRNTQQHWIGCTEGLFLAYTREAPMNAHVFRNRAPIFLARFDPAAGGLVRATERILVPELGARLGNFCVAESGRESWLVTAEWMQPRGCERYGSDNSLWLVKIMFQ